MVKRWNGCAPTPTPAARTTALAPASASAPASAPAPAPVSHTSNRSRSTHLDPTRTGKAGTTTTTDSTACLRLYVIPASTQYYVTVQVQTGMRYVHTGTGNNSCYSYCVIVTHSLPVTAQKQRQSKKTLEAICYLLFLLCTLHTLYLHLHGSYSTSYFSTSFLFF